MLLNPSNDHIGEDFEDLSRYVPLLLLIPLYVLLIPVRAVLVITVRLLVPKALMSGRLKNLVYYLSFDF